MTDQPITLTWSPLLRLSEFQLTDTKSGGGPSVYIWGFQFGNLFIPYAVGKSNRPFERAMQHYARHRGGEYAVYTRDAIMRLGMLNKRKVDSTGNEGPLYRPTSPHVLGTTFLIPKVQEEVRHQLEAFRFAWATRTDGPERTTRRLESDLADRLGRAHLQSDVKRLTARLGAPYDGPVLNHRCDDERARPLVERLLKLEGSRPDRIPIEAVEADLSWEGGQVCVAL